MCPLLTGEVSKSFEPYSAMDLSGNDLREIDSVNKVSKTVREPNVKLTLCKNFVSYPHMNV